MEYSYLQQFLDARLFILGEDNSQYQNIISTVPIVKKNLSKEKVSLISFVLLALDSSDNLHDPLLEEVEDALKRKWPTLRNKFPDQPITLLRAIIIEALTQIAKENIDKAATIYLSGALYFTYLKKGQESNILSGWLLELGGLLEEKAVTRWGLIWETPSLKIPRLTLPEFRLEVSGANGAKLKEGMKESVANGKNITNGSYNSGPVTDQWADLFSDKASKAIMTAVQSGLQDYGSAFKNYDLTTPFNNFATEFKQSLNGFINVLFENNERLNLRTNLLWWKEALYSHSQKMSYRQISINAGPIVLANDLAELVPSIYPTAVDYFLKETTCEVYEDSEKSLSEWIDLMLASSGKHILQSITTKGEIPAVRVNLLIYLHLVAINIENISNLEKRTGLDPLMMVKLTDLTVYLFHDLQANKLIAS